MEIYKYTIEIPGVFRLITGYILATDQSHAKSKLIDYYDLYNITHWLTIECQEVIEIG